MSASICVEEYARALADALAAIGGDESAKRRIIGRCAAVSGHIRAAAVPSDREAEAPVTRAAVATIAERSAA